MIAQWFYLFMSSYRKRLLGNWFHHYQRAETARVRDKRKKNLSTFTLSIYSHPSLYPFIFPLSYCFFWSGLFQVLNHQTTILLPALFVTKAVPIIFRLYNEMQAIHINIHALYIL